MTAGPVRPGIDMRCISSALSGFPLLLSRHLRS
jgi:hypothetical protein